MEGVKAGKKATLELHCDAGHIQAGWSFPGGCIAATTSKDFVMKIRKTTKWNNSFASSLIYLDFVFSPGAGLAEGAGPTAVPRPFQGAPAPSRWTCRPGMSSMCSLQGVLGHKFSSSFAAESWKQGQQNRIFSEAVKLFPKICQ